MFGLPVLDVAIGIAFFYLVFAMICTTVNESLARWFNMRPKTLEEAITQLLGSDKAKDAILKHPLIAGISRKKSDKPDDLETPSYIPAATFATALLDQLTGPKPLNDNAALMEGIKNNLPPNAARTFQALYDKVGGDFNKFHAQVEEQYNIAMDRASGWYKRYIQKQTKALAIVIVLWANFDTLHVAERLWADSAVRAAIVEDAKARAVARNTAGATDPGTSPLTEKEQEAISSITGWKSDLDNVKAEAANAAKSTDPHAVLWVWVEWALMHVFGWLISIFAISLGAPFWFDVLNRFMNLRNTGRAPDESRNKSAPAQGTPDGSQTKAQGASAGG